jgi:hypothetical protein
MTGGEVVPMITGAAKAVSAAKDAVNQDADIGSELAKQAASNSHFAAAAEVRARRAFISQVVKLKFMKPIGMIMGFKTDYFETRFPDQLAEHLAHIPADHIKEPKPYVVVPAVEQIKNVSEEPSLRDMYLNLIANAMDDRLSEDASHPSFVQVISQLGPYEAQIFERLWRAETTWGVVTLKRLVHEPPKKDFVPYGGYLWSFVVPSEDKTWTFDNISLYLTNWQRLGLITIAMDQRVVRADAYAWLEKNEFYVEARRQHGDKISVVKGAFYLTEYGHTFCKAVGVIATNGFMPSAVRGSGKEVAKPWILPE